MNAAVLTTSAILLQATNPFGIAALGGANGGTRVSEGNNSNIIGNDATTSFSNSLTKPPTNSLTKPQTKPLTESLAESQVSGGSLEDDRDVVKPQTKKSPDDMSEPFRRLYDIFEEKPSDGNETTNGPKAEKGRKPFQRNNPGYKARKSKVENDPKPPQWNNPGYKARNWVQPAAQNGGQPAGIPRPTPPIKATVVQATVVPSFRQGTPTEALPLTEEVLRLQRVDPPSQDLRVDRPSDSPGAVLWNFARLAEEAVATLGRTKSVDKKFYDVLKTRLDLRMCELANLGCPRWERTKDEIDVVAKRMDDSEGRMTPELRYKLMQTVAAFLEVSVKDLEQLATKAPQGLRPESTHKNCGPAQSQNRRPAFEPAHPFEPAQNGGRGPNRRLSPVAEQVSGSDQVSGFDQGLSGAIDARRTAKNGVKRASGQQTPANRWGRPTNITPKNSFSPYRTQPIRMISKLY